MTTRKTGRHVETEPDWEAAFSLQFRVMPVYTLVFEWCSSDVSIYVIIYRLSKFDTHKGIRLGGCRRNKSLAVFV